MLRISILFHYLCSFLFTGHGDNQFKKHFAERRRSSDERLQINRGTAITGSPIKKPAVETTTFKNTNRCSPAREKSRAAEYVKEAVQQSTLISLCSTRPPPKKNQGLGKPRQWPCFRSDHTCAGMVCHVEFVWLCFAWTTRVLEWLEELNA